MSISSGLGLPALSESVCDMVFSAGISDEFCALTIGCIAEVLFAKNHAESRMAALRISLSFMDSVFSFTIGLIVSLP